MHRRNQKSHLLLVGLFLSAATSSVLSAAAFSAAESGVDSEAKASGKITHHQFIELLQNPNPTYMQSFFIELEEKWSPSLIPMVLESIYFSSSVIVRSNLAETLAEKTGQKNIEGLAEWYQWLWNQPHHQSTEYAEFKASLYRLVDPRFEQYFRGRQNAALIRLDEIVWGGVKQDYSQGCRQ